MAGSVFCTVYSVQCYSIDAKMYSIHYSAIQECSSSQCTNCRCGWEWFAKTASRLENYFILILTTLDAICVHMLRHPEPQSLQLILHTVVPHNENENWGHKIYWISYHAVPGLAFFQDKTQLIKMLTIVLIPHICLHWRWQWSYICSGHKLSSNIANIN